MRYLSRHWMITTSATRRYLAVVVMTLAIWLVSPAMFLQAETLTVATYNLENMFDVFDNPYTKDEDNDPKSRDEIELIAKAIAATDADVVAFQELENEGLLTAMVRDLLPDSGYQYIAVIPTNSSRGINLGLISRKPIVSLTSHRFQTLTLPGATRTWQFARDLVWAKIQASDDHVVDLCVVHLKSRRDGAGDPNSVNWRTAEATRVRQIIGDYLAEKPDAMLLLVGDCNSNPDEEGVQTLLQPADNGTPILADMHAKLSTTQRITYPSTRYPNTIFDYILASPAMAKRLIPNSPMVLHDPDLIKGSDHVPVSASFDLSEKMR